jgi:hypothetical protein
MTDKWEANVGQLRLVGGVRQEYPKSLGVGERRSILPIKSRGKGRIYVLIELSGEAFGREEMCQDLVAAITEEYFHSPGTVTYGLRQAILLANTQLLRANTKVTSEHRMGGVACVVLRGSELFVAQAGWPMVYLIHGDHVEAYPDTALDFEDASMLGQRQTTEVRLFRAPVQSGDMILMADGPMARQLGSTRIGQIVSTSVARAMTNLETLAPQEDCSAMVIQVGDHTEQSRVQREQWSFTPVEQPPSGKRDPELPPQAEPPGQVPASRPRSRPSERASSPDTFVSAEIAPTPSMRFGAQPTPPAVERAAPVTPPPAPRPTPKAPPQPAGPTMAEQAQGVLVTIGQGIRTLGERMLPDRAPRTTSQRRRAARSRRSRAQAASHPNLGIAIALAIPLVALVVVGGYTVYRNWSTQSQFDAKLEAAKLKLDAAVGNAESPAIARDDWLEVIALAKEADLIQPDNPEIAPMLARAATEIDRIDGVTRLGQPYKLYEYHTSGSTPTRIIVAGLDMYVLDRGTGRVYRHTLNEQRNALQDPEADQLLLQEAQQIEGQTVSVLVDIAWMKEGGERQAGALLVLDRNGLLIEYEPSWEESHSQSLGGTDVWRNPTALQTFDANLYLLDTMANQIFKYPAQQFANAPTEWIQGDAEATSAIDIGIDGNIFVLLNSGRLDKYFGGEAIPFGVARIPKPLLSADALYMDTEDFAQYIYIADSSERRIVQLDKEGTFMRQFRPPAELEASFQHLRGLFVDEIGGKLFYASGNALYVTELPPAQP